MTFEQKEKEDMRLLIKQILQCIEIMQKKHPKMVNAREIIECPACGGKLAMIKNSFNGHIWGECETKDCLAWGM